MAPLTMLDNSDSSVSQYFILADLLDTSKVDIVFIYSSNNTNRIARSVEMEIVGLDDIVDLDVHLKLLGLLFN
jgi:ribose 5-phosphate isomerase